MSVQQEKFKAIADKIREKTGTTELIKPNDFADKIDEVYEAGLREMFGILQVNGSRTNYDNVFGQDKICLPLTSDNFKPKYPFCIKDSEGTYGAITGYRMFFNAGTGFIKNATQQVKIKELEKELGIDLTFKFKDNCTQVFNCCLFREFNVVDISEVTYTTQMFYGGFYLESTGLHPTRIEHLICSETTPFADDMFRHAYGFEYIGFEGTIGKSGLNLQYSPKLSLESAKSVLTALKDLTGTEGENVYTFTLHSDTWAKLDADGETSPTGTTWRQYALDKKWVF